MPVVQGVPRTQRDRVRKTLAIQCVVPTFHRGQGLHPPKPEDRLSTRDFIEARR